MKILVVDDSSIMRKVLIRHLVEMNVDAGDIAEAADGQEAVKMASANQYDIILMDWNMPNMLGIDALKEMRAQGNKTPIMMITTEAEKTNVIAAIQAGANNYLIKPFTKEDFVTKFTQVVGDPAAT